MGWLIEQLYCMNRTDYEFPGDDAVFHDADPQYAVIRPSNKKLGGR